MKAFGLTAFAASLFVVLGAHAGDDAALKKERAAVQGMWKITSFENSKGKDSNLEGAMLEFDKDGKSLTFTHNGETKKGSFTLNPTGKPKQIDIKPGDEDKTLEGIYQVEKDTLKLCLVNDAGVDRPSEFALKDGKNYVLVVLERVK